MGLGRMATLGFFTTYSTSSYSFMSSCPSKPCWKPRLERTCETRACTGRSFAANHQYSRNSGTPKWEGRETQLGELLGKIGKTQRRCRRPS